MTSILDSLFSRPDNRLVERLKQREHLMWQALVGMAASVMLVGTLFAEDDKPAAAPEKKADATANEVKKESTETKTEPASPQNARRQRVKGEGGGHRGKVTKASIESGVLKVTLNGKDYEFPVGDHTRAMLRTTEKEGKEVVVGVQLSNGEGRKAATRTRPAKKTKVE